MDGGCTYWYCPCKSIVDAQIREKNKVPPIPTPWLTMLQALFIMNQNVFIIPDNLFQHYSPYGSRFCRKWSLTFPTIKASAENGLLHSFLGGTSISSTSCRPCRLSSSTSTFSSKCSINSRRKVQKGNIFPQTSRNVFEFLRPLLVLFRPFLDCIRLSRCSGQKN